MPTSFPEARNPEWGFFGTIRHDADPECSWDIAPAFIAGITGRSPDATGAFLDSRHGRHFADEVSNHMAAGQGLVTAINAAGATWIRWRISARTAHETAFPRGLPYLTGYVLNAEIEADTAE